MESDPTTAEFEDAPDTGTTEGTEATGAVDEESGASYRGGRKRLTPLERLKGLRNEAVLASGTAVV